jgi:hypothetical protein
LGTIFASTLSQKGIPPGLLLPWAQDAQQLTLCYTQS